MDVQVCNTEVPCDSYRGHRGRKPSRAGWGPSTAQWGGGCTKHPLANKDRDPTLALKGVRTVP